MFLLLSIDLLFLRKVRRPKCRFLINIWLGNPPKVLQMSSIIYFYYQRKCSDLLQHAQLKHRFLFAQQSPIWHAAPWSAMFRTSSHRLFSALNDNAVYCRTNAILEHKMSMCCLIFRQKVSTMN